MPADAPKAVRNAFLVKDCMGILTIDMTAHQKAINSKRSLMLLHERMIENQRGQICLQEKQLALKDEFISLSGQENQILKSLVDDFSDVVVSTATALKPSAPEVFIFLSKVSETLQRTTQQNVCRNSVTPGFPSSILQASSSFTPVAPIERKRKNSLDGTIICMAKET
jgi:hypothetical protein